LFARKSHSDHSKPLASVKGTIRKSLIAIAAPRAREVMPSIAALGSQFVAIVTHPSQCDVNLPDALKE
jgi:hypothetical protein